MKSALVALGAAVLLATCAPALAQQTTPQPAPTVAPTAVPSVPPAGGLENDAINALSGLVKSAFGWNQNEAYGVVTYYRGYQMQIRMQLDRYRQINLHRGTVINPRGFSIRPGDTIDVRGQGQPDGSINADMITVQSPH